MWRLYFIGRTGKRLYYSRVAWSRRCAVDTIEEADCVPLEELVKARAAVECHIERVS